MIEGKKRGRLLGFPTINIPTSMSIPEGIYVSEVKIGDSRYQAATFVGAARTFGETDFKIESYLVDFDQMVYGEEVEILLYKKLRENEEFHSEEQLVEQMKQDVQRTRDYFLDK